MATTFFQPSPRSYLPPGMPSREYVAQQAKAKADAAAQAQAEAAAKKAAAAKEKQAQAQAAAEAKAQAAAEAKARAQATAQAKQAQAQAAAEAKAKAAALAKTQTAAQKQAQAQAAAQAKQAQAQAAAQAKAQAAAQAQARAQAAAEARQATINAQKRAQLEKQQKLQAQKDQTKQDQYLIDYATSVKPGSRLDFNDFLEYQNFRTAPTYDSGSDFNDYLSNTKSNAFYKAPTATAAQNYEQNFFDGNGIGPEQQLDILKHRAKTLNRTLPQNFGVGNGFRDSVMNWNEKPQQQQQSYQPTYESAPDNRWTGDEAVFNKKGGVIKSPAKTASKASKTTASKTTSSKTTTNKASSRGDGIAQRGKTRGTMR